MRNRSKIVRRETYDDSETPMEAYRKLFSAVIVQALRDAFMNLPKDEDSARAADVIRRQARAWFEGGESTTQTDFTMVCLAAGFDPDYILRIYRELKKHEESRAGYLRLSQYVNAIHRDRK